MRVRIAPVLASLLALAAPLAAAPDPAYAALRAARPGGADPGRDTTLDAPCGGGLPSVNGRHALVGTARRRLRGIDP